MEKKKLYDKVVEAVQEKYRKISFIRNNNANINNWTVLAGIVIYNILTDEITVVSLATGTDCLSDKKRDKGGMLIIDSHAEVLCHRAFKRWVLQEILKGNSKYFVKTQEKFAIKSGYKFALYSSQSPCGDCSMESLAIDSLMSINENHMIDHRKDIYVLRGRTNYDCLGVLRTKPGRADSEESQSHSCSDKIAKWQCLGLGGSFVRYHLMEPIRLDAIIIGDDFHQIGIERGLNERTSSWRKRIDINPISIFKASLGFEGARQKDKIPSNLAKLWILGMDRAEIINVGRKQGFVKPKDNIWPVKSASICSKYQLGRLFLDTIEGKTGNRSYNQLKDLCYIYQEEKSNLLLDECFKGWRQSDKKIFESFLV